MLSEREKAKLAQMIDLDIAVLRRERLKQTGMVEEAESWSAQKLEREFRNDTKGELVTRVFDHWLHEQPPEGFDEGGEAGAE